MDQTTQLVPILDAIATELGELGVTIDRLQTMLSPALFEIANNGDYVRNVQTLDLMSQRLSAISSFMISLNHSIPASCFVNSSSALREVKLSELAQRLMGEEADPDQQMSGDLDLF